MTSQGGEECSNNNHGVGVNFLPAMMPTEGSSKGPTTQNGLGHGAFFGWGGIGSDLNTKSCSNGGGVDDKSMRSGVGAWPGSIFPPPPTIAQLPTDNGFAERAARFSCFRSVMDNSAMSRFPRATNVSALMEEAHKGPAKGGVLSGNESDDAEATSTAAHEESSSSDQAKPSPSPSPSLSGKKRKKLTKIDVVPPLKDSKSIEVEKMKNIDSKVSENLKEKYDNKTKGELCSGTKAGEATLKQAKESPKNSDMPKDDYIHVRARRGQATNSHSLAERVRREKISERMKFLQDLVPGCSKVTGKAVMLDEIINYVQSLQRQVEFLSMKLAAVNPRLDFNVEGILPKDMLPTQSTSPTILFTSDTSTSYPQLHQSSHGIVHVGTEGHGIVSQAEVLRRTITSQLACLDGHGFDNPNSQVQNVWDDELQSVVQMGFVQNSHIPLTSQGTSGPLSTSNLKTDA